MQAQERRKPLQRTAAQAPPKALRVAAAQKTTTRVIGGPQKARGRPFAKGGDSRQAQAPPGPAPPPAPSAAEKQAASVLEGGFHLPGGVPELTQRERGAKVEGRLLRLIQLEHEQLAAAGCGREETAAALAEKFELTVPGVKKVLKRGRDELEEVPDSAEPTAKRGPGRPRIVSEEDAEAAAAVGRKDASVFHLAAAGELEKRGYRLTGRTARRYMRELGARPRPAIEYAALDSKVRP